MVSTPLCSQSIKIYHARTLLRMVCMAGDDLPNKHSDFLHLPVQRRDTYVEGSQGELPTFEPQLQQDSRS